VPSVLYSQLSFFRCLAASAFHSFEMPSLVPVSTSFVHRSRSSRSAHPQKRSSYHGHHPYFSDSPRDRFTYYHNTPYTYPGRVGHPYRRHSPPHRCEALESDEASSSPSSSLRSLTSHGEPSEASSTSRLSSTIAPSGSHKFDIDGMITALTREHDEVCESLARKTRETEDLKKNLADCTQRFEILSSWILRFGSEEDKRRVESVMDKGEPFPMVRVRS
jgi:NTP pyrophosphatase (non-canonical NTP hydrolase)